MTQKELENFARKLNKRMTNLEKQGLTESIDYRKLKEFAEEAGATGKGYFKNRLTQFTKQGGDIKEFERNLKLASQYGTIAKTKKMKEMSERLKKSGKVGEFISEKTLSDILESQKWTKGEGSLWSNLRDKHFDSEEILEILSFANEEDEDGVKMTVAQRFEWLEVAYSSKVIPHDLAIDYLKGITSQKKMEKKIGMSSR